MPRSATRDGVLVLAHGANNNMDHPLLKGLHERLARAGLVTVRFNFPYAEAGRKWPDPDEALEGIFRLVLEYVAEMDEFKGLALYLGGKSMGARLAAQIVAKTWAPAASSCWVTRSTPRENRRNCGINPCISCPARPCSSKAPRDPFCRMDLLGKSAAQSRSGAIFTSSPAWAIPLSPGGTAWPRRCWSRLTG